MAVVSACGLGEALQNLKDINAVLQMIESVHVHSTARFTEYLA